MSGAFDPPPSWLTARPIAHRGLHDLAAGRPENSLAAFEAAVRHGYAIECDLQPARGGATMVFHDAGLERLTGETGPVAERSSHDLEALALLGTPERIPTLAGMLARVGDSVPVVLELKGPQKDAEPFVQAVASAAAAHGGRIALMSFDHAILRLLRRHVADRPLGLTAMGGDECFDAHAAIFEETALSFVSYDVNALPSRFVAHVRERGAAAITWTVRTPEQVEATRRHADQMTFEGFRP